MNIYQYINPAHILSILWIFIVIYILLKLYKKPKTACTDGKKIYGCKKGSKAYYHELGHIDFRNKESYGKHKLHQKYFLYAFFLSLAFELFNLSKILYIIYIIYDVKEEIYAWQFCYTKLRDKNKYKQQK